MSKMYRSSCSISAAFSDPNGVKDNSRGQAVLRATPGKGEASISDPAGVADPSETFYVQNVPVFHYASFPDPKGVQENSRG